MSDSAAHVLTGALRLQAEIEQDTGHEPSRLLMLGGDWRMQALVHGQSRSLDRFDLRPSQPVDYVVANHCVFTHPASRFVGNLIAARTPADRRLSLLNREFTVRRLGREPERHTLHSSVGIRRALEQEFLIGLPAHLQLDQRPDNLPV